MYTIEDMLRDFPFLLVFALLVAQSRLGVCDDQGTIDQIVAEQVATGAESAGQNAVPTQVQRLLERIRSADFTERNAAATKLSTLRGADLQELLQRSVSDSAEVNWVVVRALEKVLQAETGPDGDMAEKQLETLSLMAGPIGVAAGDVLIRNYQLRESRAVDAIRRLGGSVSFRDPRSFPAVQQVPLNAPELGVGFGPLSIPTTIWLHAGWRGKIEDLWHIQRFSTRSTLLVYVIHGSGVDPNDVWITAAVWVPGLKVETRGAATFGIQNGLDEQPGCEVGRTLDNGPAAKAGLMAGDRIVLIEDERVWSFFDLVTYLQTKAPLDVVKVTFIRAKFGEQGLKHEVLQTNVVLGSWRTAGDLEAVPAPPAFQGPMGPSYLLLNDRPPTVPLLQQVPRLYDFDLR